MTHDLTSDAGAATAPRGLYRPEEFRDNCGFGLIAHIKGEVSHRLLQTAIESLTCMTHRGGIAADGRTGDGCGLLLQMPDAFMRAQAKETLGTDLGDHYAVGMLFLSQDPALQTQAREAMTSALGAEGLPVLGWREVPVEPDVCGEIALDQLPQIEQVFVDATGIDHEHCLGKLFTARRRAEMAVVNDPDFYICSLSDRVITRISTTPRLRRQCACSTSAFRPIRYRGGRWRSRFACWRTMARLIRLKGIAVGLELAHPSWLRHSSPTCNRWCRWSTPRAQTPRA